MMWSSIQNERRWTKTAYGIAREYQKYDRVNNEKEKAYPLQKLFGADTSSSVDGQFHFADFFIDFFHKVNDEIDQFVLVHHFSVGICYQETDVVALWRKH